MVIRAGISGITIVIIAIAHIRGLTTPLKASHEPHRGDHAATRSLRPRKASAALSDARGPVSRLDAGA